MMIITVFPLIYWPAYNLKFITSSMISIGPSLRRKSFERLEPSLPRPSPNRQPSSNGRTTYKQLKLPIQQLGEYHKRHLFTMGTLSTDKSLSRIQSEEQVMKQSRYDYDHHNTDSIAQLFQHKNDSNLHSQKVKLSEGHSASDDKKPSSKQKMSMEEESITVTQREFNREEDETEVKEGENYDDYVLGDKVEDEAEEKPQIIKKKYTQTYSTKTLLPYQSQSQSELRLQRQHMLNERRRLAQINEDKEMAMLLAQYKNNKQQMLSHCARKHEAARIIASMRPPSEQVDKNKIEKSLSLPALKPKKELIVPEDYYQERPAQPWKNTKNLISKNLQQQSQQQKRQKLRYTLSYGQLGFGKKKVRTICQQDILQQEMTSLEQIKSKLRAKGIAFDANKLKKGLLNQKQQAYNQKQIQYPSKRLPSNPIYKKFPL